MAICKECKCDLPMHRLGCAEAKGETDLYAKIEQLQAELGKRDRKIENMYHAISGIQYNECRMRVQNDIEARQKEDARTVEPIFQTEIDQLKAELEKHRWIPVSERLPKESGYYQVIRKGNGWPTTRIFYVGDKPEWTSGDIVTHWKDVILPEQALRSPEQGKGSRK